MAETKEKYEVVIGIEIHAQINVDSKMFCSCSTDSFEAEPNINTCPVCMGFPGQLPVVNDDAVKKGIIAALALNCTVPEFCKFDRKNYFYPDLPKGFQISQFDEPLAVKGWIEVETKSEKKKINITRLHLEDDAGKLTHVPNGTLCDYNRSGIPLMEIVSDPDIRSAGEAADYARAMQTVLRYTGSSDADMEKGMMRFDASVSIRPTGEKKLYARAEIKNLNSFRSLESAVAYEIERQMVLWDEGKIPDTDITVGWNEERGQTYFLRDKEGADDYRYFPEPDLPPLVFDENLIERLKKEIPEMPDAKKARYINEWGLSEEDARILSSERGLAAFFEEVGGATGEYKQASSFIVSVLLAYLKKGGVTIKESKVGSGDLIELLNLVKEGKVSLSQARGEIFEEMFDSGKKPNEIVKSKGMEQVSDEVALEKFCKEVLDENPGVVDDYKNGKQQAFGFMVGQVMKKSKGRANPIIVNEIFKKLINH